MLMKFVLTLSAVVIAHAPIFSIPVGTIAPEDGYGIRYRY
jgi:hypothetical protein